MEVEVSSAGREDPHVQNARKDVDAECGGHEDEGDLQWRPQPLQMDDEDLIEVRGQGGTQEGAHSPRRRGFLSQVPSLSYAT